MKAVRQLIDYFRASGRLTTDDLDHLLRTGVIDLETRHQESVDAWGSAYADYYSGLDSGLDSPENDFDPITGEGAAHRPGRTGRSASRFSRIDADQLCAWIDARQPEWLVETAALDRLAAHLDQAEPNLTAIRSASVQALDEATRSMELGAIWNAVTFSGYLDILDEDGATGPVSNAYRAVATAGSGVTGSKHSWLLGRPQVRWVHNLRVAQDRVLSALARYPTEQPTAFARALRVTRRALLPFVLLHMARTDRGSAVTGIRDEAGPPAKAPDIPFGDCVPTLAALSIEWMQAWEIAARMDGVPVSGLLMHYLRVEPEVFSETGWPWEQDEVAEFFHLGLHCPVTWTFMRHGSE